MTSAAETIASPQPQPPRGAWAALPFARPLQAQCDRWLGATVRKGGVALMDQAVVSGASFATTVIINRWCGVKEFGVYSLGFTIVVLTLGVLQSLVTAPYTIYVHRLTDAERKGYAGGVLVHCGLLALLAAVALAVAAPVVSYCGGPASLARTLVILVGALPFFLLREFGRRFAFADLHMRGALAFDVLAAGLQVGLLLALIPTGRVSAATAYAVAGASYALVTASWLYSVRARFAAGWRHARDAWNRNWAFSRWVLAEQMALTLNSYMMHWLLWSLLGVAATGVFAACANILCLFNPIVLGLNNIIMPRIALAMSEGGPEAVRRVLGKATTAVAALTGAFAAVILLFGVRIMRLLYGAVYAGQEGMISLLALDMLISSLATAPSYGLWAQQGSRSLFLIRVMRIAIAVTITVALVGRHGPLAAAYGLLAGSSVSTVVTFWVYRRAMAASVTATEEPALPEEVLP
jgi:O-antigen/teichoic acid export membrane protein